MKKQHLTYLLLAAAGVFLAAGALTEDRIPGGLCALLWALGGISLGFGTMTLLRELSDRRQTPAERREAALAQTDERLEAIRQKAAMSTWYWTLYLLWGLFLLLEVLNQGGGAALVSLVIVLHSVFYFANLCRWARRM